MKIPALLLALLPACAPPEPPPALSGEEGGRIGLTRALGPVELELPQDSREGSLPPSALSLDRPWRLVSSRSGHAVYQTSMPLQLRSLFFANPPAGMVVRNAAGDVVPHRRARGETWSFDQEHLIVQTSSGEAPVGWTLEYPLGTERETRLNYGFSGAQTPEDFAFTSIQDGPSSRTGVLLPAPGHIAWDLTLPAAAELRFTSGIAPSEVSDGPSSDGAALIVEVQTEDGEVETAARIRLRRAFGPQRVNLDDWSGQRVRLRLRTEPGASTRADYAFIAEPAVSSHEADPERIVMVFIDTLRPDHLSFNGYERETSPTLDALARTSTVFDQARSVAPWTLPTARSITTGRHPEVYGVVDTLQGRFRDAGWATAMFAGNVFLSANFDMHRDWGEHRVTNWPPANEQVDHALGWLQAQEGRDALLMVHFMDAHLPYIEPDAYRRRFAGDAVGGLGEEFHRAHVLRADTDNPEVRAYIEGRYDNNIRFIDDQLARLVAALDEDDTLVVFSDHGEEFWDHGGFEHGHTLYDELLRVPLIIRHGGHSGHINAPVSLLDLAPTLLAIGGIPANDLDGSDLLPAISGSTEARIAIAQRDQAIGRPLYGDIRWGVLHGTEKWTTLRDSEYLVDVSEDPDERVNLLIGTPSRGEAFPGHLGTALGTTVPEVLRVALSAAREAPRTDTTLSISVPGGTSAVWVAEDPTRKSAATVRADGEDVTVTWPRGYRATREVYVLPTEPIDSIAGQISAQGTVDAESGALANTYQPDADPRRSGALLVARIGDRSFTIGRAHVPLPFSEGEALDATDPELSSALRELGYAVE